MENATNTNLFENMPIPRAVKRLMVPTVISSLVMVVYSLADTYFVGLLNNPVQNAAVTLAAPALLAFNAVNNFFGVGSSSMMRGSRHGKKELRIWVLRGAVLRHSTIAAVRNLFWSAD